MWKDKNLILISGKGGVGKSTLAHALALHLSKKGKKVLWAELLRLDYPEQKISNVAPGLDHIVLNPYDCFKEYVALKLKIKAVYTLFLENKIVKYLAKATPGLQEMVLVGKVWFERDNYDHIVLDMPSSGYTLTMLNTPVNFSKLFPGGPIYNDCKEMIATFSDPKQCALVLVSLPEEMPIQEAIEFDEKLREIFPTNPAHHVLNRKMELPPKAIELYDKNKSSSFKESVWSAFEYLAQKIKSQETYVKSLLNYVKKSSSQKTLDIIPEVHKQNVVPQVEAHL